jgi:hypothetical protein
MPFSFVFNGSFFDMESFFAEVQRFVRVKGDRVDVRGRLLSIDGFALTSGPGGFPAVKAEISATAYLLSPDDTAASATPASPSTGAASSTATPASGPAPASNGGASASEVAR